MRWTSSDPTKSNLWEVADTFTYKYISVGFTRTPKNKLYLAAHTSPEAYQYLLGTTPAPADFNGLQNFYLRDWYFKPAEAQVVDEVWWC
jgi:hypothetical protein